MGEDE
jgi:hypothetical protein